MFFACRSLLARAIPFRTLFLRFWLVACCVLGIGLAHAQGLYDDVDRLHPGYALTDLHSTEIRPQVADLDFLPDGRLVILCLKPEGQNTSGKPRRASQLWLLSGLAASLDSGSTPLRVQVLDTLNEALGLEVVEGLIYVAEKDRLVEYSLLAPAKIESASDTNSVIKKEIALLPHDPDGPVNFQEYAFGLVYRNGYFYTARGAAVAMGGGSFARNPDTLKSPYTGGILRIRRADGELKLLNGGLRSCNGLTFGPDSSLWVTDNQGSWLPSSKLIAIEPGRNYGYVNGPNGYAEVPVSPPAVWLPYGEIARSPTHPVFLRHGRYQGQFLFGDISKGGIKRAFVEKVNGEWQGAAFSFSGGLFAGVQKILEDAQGRLYVGGLGQGDYQNWGWNGRTFGLQRLEPKAQDSTFEMLAVRARRDGLEIEFTRPLGKGSESALEWSFESAEMKSDETYSGGNMLNRAPLAVTAIRVSEDRHMLYFGLEGLRPQTVITLKAKSGVTSASGQILRCPAAWYTMNQLSESEPLSPPASLRDGSQSHRAHSSNPNHHLRLWSQNGSIWVQAPGPFRLSIFNARGDIVHEANGQTNANQPLQVRLPERNTKPGQMGLGIAVLRHGQEAQVLKYISSHH